MPLHGEGFGGAGLPGFPLFPARDVSPICWLRRGVLLSDLSVYVVVMIFLKHNPVCLVRRKKSNVFV